MQIAIDVFSFLFVYGVSLIFTYNAGKYIKREYLVRYHSIAPFYPLIFQTHKYKNRRGLAYRNIAIGLWLVWGSGILWSAAL